MGAHPSAPGVRTVRLLAVLLAAVLLAACSRVGEATIRIDEAEAEIEELTARIVEAIDLEVTASTPLGERTRCELVTTGQGAANRVAARGPIPDEPEVLERAAAVLTEAGYVLVPGADDEVFGRRDGIRITVVLDRATGEVAVDGNTACRALPR